ncbi:hypothetical protein BGX29_010521 [Mortierella sp. GBA35]|nr:hypothetical protein BGX29_010521 [Mortierella sp. GBA35]
MGSEAIEDYYRHCLSPIEIHEAIETRQLNFLQALINYRSPATNINTVDGFPRPKSPDREVLYKSRHVIYVCCAYIQYLATRLQPFHPEQAENYKHAVGLRVNRLMGNMLPDGASCSANREKAKANAGSQWLMYNLAHEFPEFITDRISRPRGRDPADVE